MRASHIVHTPAEDALRQAEVDATKSMLADMYGTQDDSALKTGDVNSQASQRERESASLHPFFSPFLYHSRMSERGGGGGGEYFCPPRRI